MARVGYNVGARTTSTTARVYWKLGGFPVRVAVRRTALPRQLAVDAVAAIVAPLFTVTAKVSRSATGRLLLLADFDTHRAAPLVPLLRLTTVMSLQDIDTELDLDEALTAWKDAVPVVTLAEETVDSGHQVLRALNRNPTTSCGGCIPVVGSDPKWLSPPVEQTATPHTEASNRLARSNRPAAAPVDTCELLLLMPAASSAQPCFRREPPVAA